MTDADHPATAAPAAIPSMDAVAALRSPARRIMFVTVGLLAAMVAVGVLSLWVTEPEPLPRATQVAFAGIELIAVAWMAYAVWGLTRQTSLLARDRVVGGGIGAVATIVTTGFAVVIAMTRAAPLAAAVALATGAALLSAALTIVMAGRREHRRLVAARTELEAELARTDTAPS